MTACLFFLKGLLLGFAIAAPVGPIGILCIRRTVLFGRFSGLFSGIGAAAADAIYASIAAFGLTFLSGWLIAEQFWLRLIGGCFLLYLGWQTFFAKVDPRAEPVTHTGLLQDFLSTFFLTLTNPMTIFAFLALFAGLGLSSVERADCEASTLVLGVFLGSTAWWLLLIEGVTLFRARMSAGLMRWTNYIAGIAIMGFGVVAVLTALFLG